MVCGNLFQLAEFARLATPLARFGKVTRAAPKHKVGRSNRPGRATLLKTSDNGFAKAYRIGLHPRMKSKTKTIVVGMLAIVRWRFS
jgi:hypothetical protein